MLPIAMGEEAVPLGRRHDISSFGGRSELVWREMLETFGVWECGGQEDWRKKEMFDEDNSSERIGRNKDATSKRRSRIESGWR